MIDFQEYPENIKYFREDMLYHYTSLETAMEKILPSRKLKFSVFSKVNDPIENSKKSASIHYSSINEEELFFKNNKDYFDIINILRLNKSRFLCFCENNEGIKFYDSKIIDRINYFKSGFFKPRMWAQYGDLHRGICLAFSKSKLKNQLKEEFSNFKKFDDHVKYDNSYMKTMNGYHIDINQIGGEEFEEFVIKSHLKEFKDELFFTKTLDWKDENEYRFLLITDSSDNDYFLNIETSLEAIFLGVDFPEVYLDSLKNIIKLLEVPIFQLVINNGIPIVNNVI